MKRLAEQRHAVRQNLPTLIGVCLCVYFIWHIIGGERSIYTLMHTERQIVKVESRLALATQEREALEARVAKLRPGSIDPDLLEERARVMLGYSRPDEHIVILPN